MESAPYLAVHYKSKRLSIAIYDEDTGKIEYGTLWVTLPDFSFISPILCTYMPQLILTSKSCPEDLSSVLSNFQTVQTVFEIGDSSITDIHEEVSLICVSALVSYLKIQVHSIKEINLTGVSCDMQTLKALQIIKEDTHPSKIKNAGRAKEGFSLFGILDRTVTPQGKKTLKQWVLRPCSSIEQIHSRLSLIEFYASNLPFAEEVASTCRNIKDLSVLLKKFRDFKAKTHDWDQLLTSMDSLLLLVKLYKQTQKPIFPSDQISELYKALKNCINPKNHSLDYPEILPGVSPELDSYRQKLSELDKFLCKLSEMELKEFRSIGIEVSTVNIVFFPQLGFHLEINFALQNVIVDLGGSGYVLQFATNESSYFKSKSTLSLDEHFGDPYKPIKETEGLILREIESEVLKIQDALIEASSAVGEIDALVSLALSADHYKLTKPEIVNESTIELINARHILSELCVDSFIPNDCALCPTHRVALVTGPNCSGKSVYLKMIGLIVYMAHIPCYVPAEIAKIGLCDWIFSRIVSTEAISMSSFASEIHKISFAMNNCSQKSLLLLDEPGKGTNSLDGMSLIGGILSYLDKPDSPLTIVTTHFQELVTHSFINESLALRFYTMEMAYSEQPVFLYKLIRGRPNGSFGFNCARLAGISPQVIKRAECVREGFRNKTELRPVCKTGRAQKAKEIISLFSRFKENSNPEEFFHDMNNVL